MIRLEEPPHGWLTLLPGIRARFDPIDRRMVRRARRAVQGFLVSNPDLDEADRQEGISDIFSQTLIRAGLRDWEGFGDPEGNAIAPDTPVLIEHKGERLPYSLDLLAELDSHASPATVITGLDLFMARALLVEAADDAYVLPWALQDAEKNASAPLSAGTSARAMQATTIATSAVPAGKAKGKGARRARIAKTSRAPTRAKASGKS